jgi:hypothetical protein
MKSGGNMKRLNVILQTLMLLPAFIVDMSFMHKEVK